MLQLSPPLSTVNNAEHVYKCWFKYPFSILLGIYIPRGRTVGTSHDSVFNVSVFSAASTTSFKRPKRKKKVFLNRPSAHRELLASQKTWVFQQGFFLP